MLSGGQQRNRRTRCTSVEEFGSVLLRFFSICINLSGNFTLGPIPEMPEQTPLSNIDVTLLRDAKRLEVSRDAAIFVYSGPMDRDSVSKMLREAQTSTSHQNCILLLTTFGGDGDAAYILARHLKRVYKRVTLLIFGDCKSAGTLAAIGAHEIVMGPFGELGPLDIQLAKEDSFSGRSSGLDIFQGLTIVSSQAYEIFERHFLELIARSGGVISTKTAAHIASELASSLLTPITAQIDPLRLGEMQRAVQVAQEYGTRLGGSLATVQKLITGYPAHDFVIDIQEATELFEEVRVPDADETALANSLSAWLVQYGGEDNLRTPHPHGIHLCLTVALSAQGELFDAKAADEDPNVPNRVRDDDGSIGSPGESAGETDGGASEPDDEAEPS